MAYTHAPVMVREVAELLKPEAHKKYLDGTVGGGGHAEELLTRGRPDSRVLALDWDEEAISEAQDRLQRFRNRLIARRANFVEAKAIMNEIGWEGVDGVLLDLGLSSRHVESPERGFSFRAETKLDMRMDRRRSVDAYAIVNTFPVSKLTRILRQYGEEPEARRIALAIDWERKKKPIKTPADLARIIANIVRRKGGRIHPATRTFQALRIAVNQELKNLEGFLEKGYELLLPGGRMVIISFHSLEDRVVKNAFRKWNKNCLCPPKVPLCNCGWSRKVRLLTPRPVLPSRQEVQINPRARSAKLRAVERL
jgi:16S rRNA (cytosine1402-N4)-methyltransferase